MKFIELGLAGAFVVELEKWGDERGFFARAWCRQESELAGLNVNWVQANLAFSERRGTLRGLHYQIAPCEEDKLVRCTMGAVYDVIVDLRPDLPTYRRWMGIELSAENRRMIYVPAGFAHGYQSLVDGSETFYFVSQYYRPGSERGIRFNDPAFGIEWPLEVRVISDKDKSWPDYRDSEAVRVLSRKGQ